MVNVSWSWLVVSSVAHIEDCIVASQVADKSLQVLPIHVYITSYHIISHHITAFVLHMALLTSHVPTMYSFETHGRWFGHFFCLEEPLRLMVDAWISKGFEENYANLYEAWWKWPRALAADFEPIIVYAMNGHRSSVGSIHIIMEYNQWYIHI